MHTSRPPSQYTGTSSYIDQQSSAKYNGTTSVLAKFGWYPAVRSDRRPCHIWSAV
jgi:hypothetical protein